MAEMNMGNLYDFNKNAMKQEKPIDVILANKRLSEISRAMKENGNYYFMICPDNRQYIMFHVDEKSTCYNVQDELTEVLNNRGKLIDIDMTNSDKQIWEFWIEDKFTNELYMYQLINYSKDIVEC
jgi:hypothetical protein